MWRRNDRINERDVPESQHTIFIRGLPGEMGTDQLRDFFEKDFGACSFDFVKVSPDRSKLYVAVRFESKSCARDVMENFGGEGELLGYQVEMSWFRDIRRYLAHCAKQGVRPSRFRGGVGGGGVGGGGAMAHRRGHQRGAGTGHRAERDVQERSRSSRSRSADANSRTRSPNSRKGSPDSRSSRRTRSAASRSRSRTKSASSVARSSPEREKSSLDYSDIATTKKKEQREPSPSPTPPPVKKPKKSAKKKRHRERAAAAAVTATPIKKQKQQRELTPPQSSSLSPDRRSDSDVEVASDDDNTNNDVAVNSTGGSNKQHQQQQQQPAVVVVKKNYGASAAATAPTAAAAPSFASRHIPAGTVAASAAAAAAAGGVGVVSAAEALIKTELRNQTIMLDMSDPKAAAHPLHSFKAFGEQQQQPFVDRLLNDCVRVDPVTTAAAAAASLTNNGTNLSPFSSQMRNGTDNNPVGSKMQQQHQNCGGIAVGGGGGGGAGLTLNNFKEIQRAILLDVRYKPQEASAAADEDSASLGQLRLSSLSRKTLTEDKREEKVAKLSPELRDRVNKKKRQLELSYRNDCETYGLVANKLVAKDRLLEDRLKLALLETMKELEAETMKQLDDFLDQISFMF